MRKFEAFENPRIVELSDGVYGASFFLMKLLPARFMLERAVEQGLLKPGATICESSSGNSALALAMLAVQHGYKLILVSDWTLDRHLHRRLLGLGAHVEIVDEPAPTGGFQQARLDRLGVLLKEIPNSYWPAHYSNADNPIAYAKFAELLIDRVGEIDCLVGSVGSGGSICGTSKYLRILFPELHAVGVDAPGSVLFGQRSGRLRLYGTNIVPSNLDHRHFDEIHWLTRAEAFYAAHQLHRDHGLFLGPTSGAASELPIGGHTETQARRWSRSFPTRGIGTSKLCTTKTGSSRFQDSLRRCTQSQ
ncbi:pyridoxal-phosphate dependent enzyme [Sinorhizobium sp. 7-81]|uniref:pyridoxal-phosphate dependent enzyme n=1 Tax=Sinorhizobium sp. 8-89 TaxID=3049089 RepID=UPI0024C385E8|nr:pyridoxal-phosphate dependent enzyme [Sinorhizobium sp. 8-89]MDK1492907.1 pyridoxal-phosphate dependent enzyme [Sinorhizobium sp. 8-89]